MVKRFLDTLNSDDIYDDVVEKKALPELLLKANIIRAEESMLYSFEALVSNKHLWKRFLRQDIVRFQGSLLILWGYIRFMAEDQGIGKDDKIAYNLLRKLESGSELRPNELFFCKSFLLKCLHNLNLSNLLQTGGKSFRQQIEDEY